MELRRLDQEAGQTNRRLPLLGLPHHCVYQNVIYEIIDAETLEELAVFAGGGPGRYTLKGEDIPRFADARSRLVFQFGDDKLKALLSEDSVFADRKKLSLVLGTSRSKSPWAMPFLRYRECCYPAEEVSRRMEKEYMLLNTQWVRREDLMAAGLFPLLCYAGGRAIEMIKLKPGELLRRGGSRLAGGVFSDLEADTGLWLERGSKAELFHAHLEFLCGWGLSGGAVITGHRDQVACLVSWLKERACSGAGNTLALVEKRYYDLYLQSFLPELEAAGIALPDTGGKTGDTPARIAFYEDLPLSPVEQRSASAVLVLIEPEEALAHAETFVHLRNIKAGITLGIFTGAWELFRGSAASQARNLFGVTDADLLPYLIRDTARALSLPKFEFPPPLIFRPPALLPEPNVFKYTVEEKFTGLSGPALYSEIVLLRTGGPPAPFVPLRLLKGSLDIDRMDGAERAFFVYWREEFRGGNIIKTSESYIRVYARELCLFAEGDGDVSGNFRRLLKLWESYREVFDSINSFLPRWLIDFAVMYETADNALPLLVPYARECNDPLLMDIYLYKRFINENNSFVFGDIAPLIPKAISGSAFFNDENADLSACRHRLMKDYEIAVNAVDRFLRERFHLRLFEFFYPQVYHREKREAFPDMERSGRSSYIVEGIRFSKHLPLIDFLASLFRYIEYCFRLKHGFDIKGKNPPFGKTWKMIVDSALGMEDMALIPVPALSPEHVCSAANVPAASAPPALMPRTAVTLRDSRLAKLRADSDAVRDLLMIEDESGQWEISRQYAPNKKTPPKTGKAGMKDFIKGLSAAERETLKIIAGMENTALADFARKHHVMPEPLIDGINAVFLEQYGDILIDTVDEQPFIQSEYIDELRKNWKRTGNIVS
jgi:hypothetical protein